jgi:hypothetical protein
MPLLAFVLQSDVAPLTSINDARCGARHRQLHSRNGAAARQDDDPGEARRLSKTYLAAGRELERPKDMNAMTTHVDKLGDQSSIWFKLTPLLKGPSNPMSILMEMSKRYGARHPDQHGRSARRTCCRSRSTSSTCWSRSRTITSSISTA